MMDKLRWYAVSPTLLGLLFVIFAVMCAIEGLWHFATVLIVFGIYIPGLKDLRRFLIEGIADAVSSPHEDEKLP